ncbi:MAG: BlaI family penicillinase repressor [Verrucomicrobiales bacterium]|jgi:BlaI family penicillinase repressor
MSPPPSADSSGLPKLSEAEWFVMKSVWEYGPLSAKAICELLRRDGRETDLESVKTYLARLHKKGAVGFFRQGRAYCYFSEANQDAMIESLSDSFWGKVPRANRGQALLQLCNSTRGLTRNEVDEITKTLNLSVVAPEPIHEDE